jgi:serine/threonine protein kinase/tetratricopeptide (TPR) repeat protein
MIGSSLTHYRITGKLGEGGMGEVYRATDIKLGREVAIKVLPSRVSRDSQGLARFEREAKALAALNHPHIAGIYGFEADQQTHFLVLELVEGETLAERLRRGPLPTKEALSVARQIAEAIQEAHEKGIIHRDLKPGNVKITPNGRVKVLDFGLVKMEQAMHGEAGPTASAGDPEAPTITADSTVPGAVMGTPAYMSPEQARGQAVDKRTDVWAFGCCLYECLAGKKPFAGQTATELIAEVLKSEPDWSQIPSKAPREVVTLLRRCLEKDPARRLSSIGDIAITLDEASRALGGSSAPPVSEPANPASSEMSPVGVRWGRRRSLGIALLILAVAAGIVLWKRLGPEPGPQTGSAGLQTNRSPLLSAAAVADEKSIGILPFRNLSSDQENDYFAESLTEELQSKLLKVGGLRVIPMSGANYRTQELADLGRQFNVRFVLRGSASKAERQVRIHAQLVETRSQELVWADDFQEEFNHIFAFQDEVTRHVAEALRGRLLPADQSRLAKHPTANLEAYDLYLRGRAQWNRFSDAGLHQAVRFYEQAIQHDANFALAYSGLSDCYNILAIDLEAPASMYPKAKSSADRALALDDSLPQPHVSAGMNLLFFELNWKEAERELKRAIEIQDNYADAHHYYAHLLEGQGRVQEAQQQWTRAGELDPTSLQIAQEIGFSRYLAEDFAAALTLCLKAVEMDTTFIYSRTALAAVYSQTGKPDAAVELTTATRGMTDGNIPSVIAELGYAQARSGHRAPALELLHELEQRRAAGTFVDPWDLAVVHVALGENDQALADLSRAIDERSTLAFWMKVEPKFKPLRNNPQFHKLLVRAGLEE